MSRGLGSTPLHLLFAFVAMGGWAGWANAAYPAPEPLVAGLLQGTLSAALTLYLKHAVEWLAARTRGHVALWLPPLGALAGSAGVLVGLHALAGTPALLVTVAVPLLVSGSYVTLYHLALWRSGRT
ncbi:hypothetical protein [Halomonas borealis]|uniref:hypothetical protein n=1 Tax=Halomonas borealis TaxID=2508710 RepID=UPI00197AD984|nr:hypothetical protein [Halomonas borealis]